ncbi:MAG: hypothetical protein M1118_02415 [Chloroflexi bacterium]|nr:hypothetical protein [Chloroflexota bacterium]
MRVHYAVDWVGPGLVDIARVRRFGELPERIHGERVNAVVHSDFEDLVGDDEVVDAAWAQNTDAVQQSRAVGWQWLDAG